MIAPRPLNSDDLGHKGERRFAEMCTDAKLICNKSERDRTGWDFIVEFPIDPPTGSSSLDKRAAPISCHFQIKTIWSNNDRFKMRLSAAERLAKDPKPTFICVMKVAENLTFSETYIIHLADEVLAAILKRLRNEQANGNKKINDIFIYLSAKTFGKKIDPTGDALKAAIADACGSDTSQYATRKKRMLEEIGFQEPRVHGNVSFRYEKDEDLIDVFLGRGTVETTRFEVYETRFGISLPQTDKNTSKGKLSVEPTPSEKCKVVFRCLATGDSAFFEADILSSPKVFSETIGWKIAIRGEVFEITHSKIRGEEKTSLSINTNEGMSQEKNTDEWINYATLLLILSEGNFSIKIIPQKSSVSSNTIYATEKLGSDSPQKLRDLLKFLSATKRVLQRAAIQDRKFNIDEIAPNYKKIFELAEILDGKAKLNPIKIALNKDGIQHLKDKEDFETLLIDFAQIGKVALAYSCQTKLSPRLDATDVELTSRELLLLEIEEIKDFPAGFEQFVEIQKSRSKLVGLVVNYPVLLNPPLDAPETPTALDRDP